LIENDFLCSLNYLFVNVLYNLHMGKYINITLNNIYLKKNGFAEKFKILAGYKSEK